MAEEGSRGKLEWKDGVWNQSLTPSQTDRPNHLRELLATFSNEILVNKIIADSKRENSTESNSEVKLFHWREHLSYCILSCSLEFSYKYFQMQNLFPNCLL